MKRTVRALSLALAAVAACSHGSVAPPDAEARLIVTADLSGTAVATVVVEVTASDFPTALLFNLHIVNSVASGTISLPAGSNRTVTMRAYDAGGVETHSGSVTLDVQAGTNPTISMVLTPLTGDVPIQASLGSFSVTVPPPSKDDIHIDETLPLTAVVKDWNGNTITATVAWATADPSIATVDVSGLVTGIGPGSTTIAATYRGAIGTATVTVEP